MDKEEPWSSLGTVADRVALLLLRRRQPHRGWQAVAQPVARSLEACETYVLLVAEREVPWADARWVPVR